MTSSIYRTSFLLIRNLNIKSGKVTNQLRQNSLARVSKILTEFLVLLKSKIPVESPNNTDYDSMFQVAPIRPSQYDDNISLFIKLRKEKQIFSIPSRRPDALEIFIILTFY